MLTLYKILILDVEIDNSRLVEIKRKLYHNFYMDNGGFTTNDCDELKMVYELLPSIFNPYKFPLQQFYTNNANLQKIVCEDSDLVDTPTIVPLLGLLWDRSKDTISAKKMTLNVKAQSKREILRSIASNFDLYNFNAPMLNRARLFFNKLQIDRSLNWDSKLDKKCAKNVE